jgi:hypothetical protein
MSLQHNSGVRDDVHGNNISARVEDQEYSTREKRIDKSKKECRQNKSSSTPPPPCLVSKRRRYVNTADMASSQSHQDPSMHVRNSQGMRINNDHDLVFLMVVKLVIAYCGSRSASLLSCIKSHRFSLSSHGRCRLKGRWFAFLQLPIKDYLS